MGYRPDIRPGETILWCDEEYKVIENIGSSGIIEDGGGDRFKFYWDAFERSITKEEQIANKGW